MLRPSPAIRLNRWSLRCCWATGFLSTTSGRLRLPAWPTAGRSEAPKHATIFRDQLEGVVGATLAPPDTLGVPRFTMTALDGRLFARMGNPVTSRAQGRPGPY